MPCEPGIDQPDIGVHPGGAEQVPTQAERVGQQRNRILPFDERAGLHWARLMAEGKSTGRPRSELDMIIASVAGANDCVVATNNERDFAGL